MKYKLIGRLTGKIIPGDTSRRILDAIKDGRQVDPDLARLYEINNSEIAHLKSQYYIYRDRAKSYHPRLYPFHLMLKEKYPKINWDITRINPSATVNFKLPLVNNLQPSLLTLLLGRVAFSEQSSFQCKSSTSLLASSSEIRCFDEFLSKTDALELTTDGVYRLLRWCSRACSGSATIFIITCPDYSVEPTNNKNVPYKHNFASVGTGIGQIASRVLNMLPNLCQLLSSLDLDNKVQLITTIADYEGFSEKIARRLNISLPELRSRIEKSRQAFNIEAQQIMPSINCINFTSICGGKVAWLKKLSEIKAMLHNENYGSSEATMQHVISVARQRKALYSRWYESRHTSFDTIKNIAVDQIAEYATMGYYLSLNYENILVLGADSELFEPFYRMYDDTIAAIYFKRRYC